jgi:FixJ family two-component response regulator
MVRNILIVDDQHEVRRMLRAGIETLDLQLQVLDMPSAEESLVVIAMQPVDLLVTDIRLPGISGLELMEKIRRRNRELKVIFITGLPDPDIHMQVKQAGAEAFFFKPIQMADFLDAVCKALGMEDQPERAEQPLQNAEPALLNLADRLTNLRLELNAVAVVLINDRGETIAQTGELPHGEIESTLVAALASTLSAGAKVALSLKQAIAQNLLLFKGSRYNLCVANTSSSHALIVLLDAQDPFPAQIPNVVDRAVKSLSAILKHPTPPTLHKPDQPSVELAEEDLDMFEDILGKVSSKKIGTDELNRFWESSSGEMVVGSSSANVLTYEQARKLGLAPKDK